MYVRMYMCIICSVKIQCNKQNLSRNPICYLEKEDVELLRPSSVSVCITSIAGICDVYSVKVLNGLVLTWEYG